MNNFEETNCIEWKIEVKHMVTIEETDFKAS